MNIREIAEANEHLEHAGVSVILQWAVEQFYPKIAIVTAFGPEGCVILHYMASIKPEIYAFNLDTGYQFQETLNLRDKIHERYGIDVQLKKPKLSVEEYEIKHGGPLYLVNPDQCCKDRKVQVFKDSIKGMDCWISGLRRDQSEVRRQSMVVDWDSKFNMLKINPLVCWSGADVWDFIRKHDVPHNALHAHGYSSIGCWPCTRAVDANESERDGRWSGCSKTECGLHTNETKFEQGDGI